MSTVAAPAIPLYDLGFLARAPQMAVRAPRMTQSVRTPRYPLYQLGWLGASVPAGKIVGSTAPVDAAVTGLIASAAGAGAWAGPIGAGVGAIVGIIAGLMSAHEQRASEAKDENSAMNIGVQGFDSDLKTVQAAFNSGQIGASDAIQAVQVLMQNYWALVTPHIQPGRNGCSGGANCPSSVPNGAAYCQGNIGAACCVGCGNLEISINAPDGVIAAINGQSTSPGGKNTADIMKVTGSKYGGQTRNAYTISFQQTGTAAAVSSIESSLTSEFSSLGSSSLLPLLGIGLLAFLVLR